MNGPHVLRDYALIADGERGAIVGPRGEITWLCFPGWDAEPVVASLLGGAGEYVVRPSEDHFVWGGQYDDDTLVWRNRWMVGGSIVECVEAMAFPGQPDRMTLVRQVRAVAGPASVDATLTLRAPDGTSLATRPRHYANLWEFDAGGLFVRWTVPSRARWSRGVASLHIDLEPGSCASLVLELATSPLTMPPPDADQTIRETTERWRSAARRLQGCRAERDARTGLTLLRGLTAGTGAMVAAATTSLPERADEGRNYDYRYAWIRDQCYAGTAGRARRRGRLSDPRRCGAVRVRARPGRRPGAAAGLPRVGRTRTTRAHGRSSRLSGRAACRVRQSRWRPVPARRVRRGAAALRRGGRGRPSRRDGLARRRRRGRCHRAARARA